MVTDATLQQLLETYQKNEITEYHIYKNLAKLIKEDENRDILKQIAEDERPHALEWQQYTQRAIQPKQ